jgi:RNA-binding protein
MSNLTSRQRAHLRKLAHHLKPVVLIGSDGISAPVIASIADALNTRELLKIKLQESAPLKAREVADRVTDALEDAHSVQIIGKTIVLYRPHPEEPEIRLPKKVG